MLIDGSLFAKAPGFLARIGWTEPVSDLFAGIGWLAGTGTSPLLSPINPSDPVAGALLEKGLPLGSLHFLKSDASQDEVAAHLVDCMDMTLPDGRETIFRFFDTRVLTDLAGVLSVAQVDALLGPVIRWQGVDLYGRHFAMRPGKSATELGSNRGSLRLTQNQIDALGRLQLIHTLCGRLREYDFSIWQGIARSALYDRLRAALAWAGQSGMRTTADQLLLGLLSFRFPPGFDAEAPFADAVDAARSGRASLDNALAKVTSAQWTAYEDRHLELTASPTD